MGRPRTGVNEGRKHPLPGAPVGRVDLCFPDALLIVELDGGLHRLPQSRRSDYERDIAAAREGWLVVRFEWFHVRFRPAWFAASVADIRQQRLTTVQAA